MRRDKNLIPLSHQHQHALALCVRIGKAFADSAATPDVHGWEQEIVKQFDEEMSFHFGAEEKHVFPVAARFEELATLLDSLLIDHTVLRRSVEKARTRQFTVSDLQVFTASLSEHIRKEERDLFEALPMLLTPDELNKLGAAIQQDFQQAQIPGATCEIHEDREPE
jgi:iron-sulfur cluster repair protein YtfE (RIC family)